jgi:hypothetical protein
MRRTGCAMVLAAALAGCASGPTIRTAAGPPRGSVSEHGLALDADPHAWRSDPSDLASFLTPIAVRIVNRTGQEVRVAYSDFSLTDEREFRYGAINPYAGPTPERTLGYGEQPPIPAPSAPAPRGEPPASDPAYVPPGEVVRGDEHTSVDDRSLMGAQIVLARAGHGGGFVGTHGGSGGYHGGGYDANRGQGGGWRGGFSVVPPGGWSGPRRYFTVPGSRFYVHPYLHHYFGLNDPWPYAYFYWPWYGPYVYAWNDASYTAAPSDDVLRLGLPEGVLKPGGEVRGFIYFQGAQSGVRALRLQWSARRTDGSVVESLSIPFVVE